MSDSKSLYNSFTIPFLVIPFLKLAIAILALLAIASLFVSISGLVPLFMQFSNGTSAKCILAFPGQSWGQVLKYQFSRFYSS